MLSIRKSIDLTVSINSMRVIPGIRPCGPGDFVESAKSRVCPTVRVAMWISSRRVWIRRPISGGANRCFLTFLVVENFTLVKVCHFLCINTSVPNIAFNRSIILTFVSDSLQKSSATSTGTTKHETHFTGFKHTGLSRRTYLARARQVVSKGDITCVKWSELACCSFLRER